MPMVRQTLTPASLEASYASRARGSMLAVRQLGRHVVVLLTKMSELFARSRPSNVLLKRRRRPHLRQFAQLVAPSGGRTTQW